jgi:hypothetical protein
MVLGGKFLKTGGLHIVFILCGTICDEKKIILAAAFPGVFFNGQNNKDFSPIF